MSARERHVAAGTGRNGHSGAATASGSAVVCLCFVDGHTVGDRVGKSQLDQQNRSKINRLDSNYQQCKSRHTQYQKQEPQVDFTLRDALWYSHNTVSSSPHRHPTYSGAHAGSVPHCRLTVPGARVTSNLGKVERPRRLTAGNAQPSPQWQPLPKVRNHHTEQNRAYLAPLPHWQPSDAVL